MTRNAPRADALFALGLVAFFLVIVGLGARYPRDARLFPLIIGTMGLGLSAAVFAGAVRRLRRDAGRAGGDGSLWHGGAAARARAWAALLAAPGYGLLLWLAGFWVASSLSLFGLAWLLGYRRTRTLVAVTVGTVLAVWLFFPLGMGIRLPEGLVFAWLRRAVGTP